MIRILAFEDNSDFSDSLRELISSTLDMELVAVANNCKNAVKLVEFHKPDVVLMDIDMPQENGLQGLRSIRNSGSEVVIVMLTVFEDDDRIFQAVCSGASGYLLKKTSPIKLLESLRDAYEGGSPMTPSVARQVLKLFSKPFKQAEGLQSLTPRENDVLSFLVRGYSYKMAAHEMKVSIETFRTHIKNIYSKLHINSKSEAVALAIQNKWI
jgi:DNA-binding NarL/FixJ family response regulator